MKRIIAANWKMFKTISETREMITQLSALVKNPGCEVLIFPPFTALCVARQALTVPNAAIGGQDVYPATEGAFTGEISPAMLMDAGCSWVLTGHSERRHILFESPEFVGQKTSFALKNGLNVILCIGERLEEREAGHLSTVLARQLESVLAYVPHDVTADNLVIAYEPVWAIGTGKSADSSDISEAHALTRRILVSLLKKRGEDMRILYGGSVKPDNAKSILDIDNVNGLLVGGASLQAKSFASIIQAAG